MTLVSPELLDPATEFCLDRNCKWQLLGPHTPHTSDSSVYSVSKSHPLLKKSLEELKTLRGHICQGCHKYLIPTDGDHSFCDPCWDEMLEE